MITNLILSTLCEVDYYPYFIGREPVLGALSVTYLYPGVEILYVAYTRNFSRKKKKSKRATNI